MKKQFGAITTVARYTALEAVRTRYGWLLLAAALGGLGLAAFSDQLAITESRQIQAALSSSALRLAAVFLLALFVITSTVREFSDKTTELMFSLPLPKGGYYLGKLAGYALVALATAMTLTLLMALFAAPAQALSWGLSLLCELLIVCAAALACAYSFAQVPAALAVLAAFYLLSRSISAIQLMAQGPLVRDGSLSQQVINRLVDLLAWLLPQLERFTRSDWLVYTQPAWDELTALLAQTLIYLLLLSGVALFDLYRKNF